MVVSSHQHQHKQPPQASQPHYQQPQHSRQQSYGNHNATPNSALRPSYEPRPTTGQSVDGLAFHRSMSSAPQRVHSEPLNQRLTHSLEVGARDDEDNAMFFESNEPSTPAIHRDLSGQGRTPMQPSKHPFQQEQPEEPVYKEQQNSGLGSVDRGYESGGVESIARSEMENSTGFDADPMQPQCNMRVIYETFRGIIDPKSRKGTGDGSVTPSSDVSGILGKKIIDR